MRQHSRVKVRTRDLPYERATRHSLTNTARFLLLAEYIVGVYTQRIVAGMESRLTLLGLLSAGPGHGYDLKRSWDHWFAASKPLAYGQVYATLARLVRDGLITQVETEPCS